jgi:hypothetical protein
MEFNQKDIEKMNLFMKVASIYPSFDIWSEIDKMFRVEFELEPMEFDKAVTDAVSRWTHYLTTRRMQEGTEPKLPRKHTWTNTIIMGAFDPIDDETAEFLDIDNDRVLSVGRFFKFWIDYAFWDIWEDEEKKAKFPLRVFLDRIKVEDNFWHYYLDSVQA